MTSFVFLRKKIIAFGFGMKWGWINSDKSFFFGWTMPLKPIPRFDLRTPSCPENTVLFLASCRELKQQSGFHFSEANICSSLLARTPGSPALSPVWSGGWEVLILQGWRRQSVWILAEDLKLDLLRPPLCPPENLHWSSVIASLMSVVVFRACAKLMEFWSFVHQIFRGKLYDCIMAVSHHGLLWLKCLQCSGFLI